MEMGCDVVGNTAAIAICITVKCLQDVSLVLGELLPGGLEPIHVLDCLSVALFQNVDLLDTIQDSVLLRARVVCMRHPVIPRAADRGHLLPFRSDLVVGVLDDEPHGVIVLQCRDRGRPLVQILPHDTHDVFVHSYEDLVLFLREPELFQHERA